MTSHTAYDGMVAILNCNEVIEHLRKQNNDNIPDLTRIQITDLLSDYRELMIEEMRHTTLEVFKN